MRPVPAPRSKRRGRETSLMEFKTADRIASVTPFGRARWRSKVGATASNTAMEDLHQDDCADHGKASTTAQASAAVNSGSFICSSRTLNIALRKTKERLQRLVVARMLEQVG